MIDKLRSRGDIALSEAANELMDRWQGGHVSGRISRARVHDILSRVAAERAVAIASACTALARDAAQVLQDTAQALGLRDGPTESEMTAGVQEMPWLDVGDLNVHLRANSFLMRLGKDRAKRQFERKLSIERSQDTCRIDDRMCSCGRSFS